MRFLILSFLALICSTSHAQTSSLKLKMDWVLLTGNQTVYDYNPKGSKERYKQTYVWPKSTYTLFRINDKEKKVAYYTVAASTVTHAKNKFTKDADIIRHIMNTNKPNIVFEYEILEIIEPIKGYTKEYLSGKMYILKLPNEKKKDANTTIEIINNQIRYSSSNLGKPYHTRYPVLNNEFFVNLKDW